MPDNEKNNCISPAEQPLDKREEKKRRRREKHSARVLVKRRRRAEREAERSARADRRKGHEKELTTRLKEIAALQTHTAEFYGLDNAGIMFTSSASDSRSNLFRINVIMKEAVDPEALQWAVNDLVPRFPTFTSAIKRGLFWYYLEPSSEPLVIEKQSKFPCRPIFIDARHALVRITYYSHQISVEFFHSATDGNGGIVFVNSLIAAYLKRRGIRLTDMTNCADPLDKPRRAETEDSFARFADRRTKRQGKDVLAYKIPGHRMPKSALILTKGTCSGKALNAVAKARGLTVTQFLIAVLIWAIQTDRDAKLRSGKKPVVIEVPANLRKLFPSETLRNFVSLMPVVSDNSSDFDALCACVKSEFDKKLSLDYFRGLVNFNVTTQENPFMKAMPLVLKNLAIWCGVRILSDHVTTTLFSNLGVIRTPKDFTEHVARYDFNLGRQVYAGTVATAVTFNDRMVITLARTFREHDVERLFFTKLATFVPVTVETNHMGDDEA